MSKTISPFEVADLNRELAGTGFPGRIRLHDICGGQSLSYEGEDGLSIPVPAPLRSWLEKRLGARGYAPRFDERGALVRLG